MSPPDSGECAGAGDPSLADCLRLLEAVPAAAASSPAFRRHWPSISASLATLSTALSSPAFPPAAPILGPLAAALEALMSVAGEGGGQLGHLHTVSLLSSSAAALAQLAADARLLAAPPAVSAAGGGSAGGDGVDGVISRLRMGSAASRAAALEDLAEAVEALPPSSAAAAVSAVAALLDSGDLLPPTRDRAVSVLAAFADSEPTCRSLTHECPALLPHLCRALESSAGPTALDACLALLPLTAASRDAAAAVATRGGVASLLSACAAGTPAAQAAAAAVLRNLAAFPDLLAHFRDEANAVPLLLQLVALGTPRAQEMALACLQNLTAGDADDAQRLRVDAFQEGALACVKDFLLDHATRGGADGPGRAPALGLLRNLASFHYVAEVAASGGFVGLVAAALCGSDRPTTRAEAALALAELCGNVSSSGKLRKELPGSSVVPRLVWMLEAKSIAERDAAARALAALLATSSGGYRKLFKRDERGVVNAVQLLDPAAANVDKRFPVAVLLAMAQSRRCRKQMVAAGACGFVQGLVDAEVDGAKKLAECLGKGKMLGVFPRT